MAKNGTGEIRTEFETLLRKHQDRIYNLCRYMLRDSQDAQDAAQDVFLKAYRGMKDFSPEAFFYAWLYRIAVNTCLDRAWPWPSLYLPADSPAISWDNAPPA